MDGTVLFTGAVQYLILLLGISLHEASHAWLAARRGDPTASLLGRASLNPLRHLDPLGSVLLPALLLAFGVPVFGWGRPTPVVVKNLKDPWRDDLQVTAAGSLANLLLALAATVGLVIAVHSLGPPAREAANSTLLRQFPQAAHLAGFPIVFTLVQAVYINGLLALFNLIPLPPLDGGQIVLLLLPVDWAEKWEKLKPYGFLIAIFLGVSPVLNLLMLPLVVVLTLVIRL